ncbi:glycosyltransferase family 4 protein [Glaciimonas immobilis]|uniref:Glycosyltransferase involved in cell wall biosynthesis n=1 Tax=Glaciimonas immobilis TaxID=728004 RepID=A0A840RLH3_9BURK|nr:glycosyltransferase family 1 protein [Glaciimonas immobilis]KAF3998165.1 glycosyltransferase family 4 protein [Glaciimonas immobilis]MBB5199127.1 glycosyltransferase involved in cell wall biosynthesis [Glaciimonas immobilis]
MRLKIGIDFHVLDGKFQGSRTHVLELFSRLIAQSPDIDFYLFLDKPELLLTLSSTFSASNVHRIRMPQANPLKRLYWQLPRLARKYELDILHTQYILPWPLSCLGIVTIHDVLFETHPEYFEWIFVLRSRVLMRVAAKYAAHVFAVSEFSRSEIKRLYGIPESRISVALNGADFTRFIPGKEGEHLLKKRGLVSGGYILSVGRLEPRKNHRLLVEAYAMLDKEALPLVLIGQPDFQFDDVFTTITRLNLWGRVHVFEDVSDIELPVLYRHACLFVYPAFAEGFGMPPLEAMASGVPVIVSNTTAIPEVVGDAGVLISPYEVAPLAAAMKQLLADPLERIRLSCVGHERALSFNWDAPARQVRERYLAAMGR